MQLADAHHDRLLETSADGIGEFFAMTMHSA
jgi:hypothetical protein